MNFEHRKVFLYAIIPALIAGAFSLAPKLYDILMEPRAELSYDITLGPNLATPSANQRIGALVVSNSGKKPLSSVSASLAVEKAEISAFQIQIDPALKGVSRRLGPDNVVFEVPFLLPAEQFSVSFMLSSDDRDTVAKVGIRSSEVLGAPAQKQDPKKLPVSELLGSALAGISVFFMVLLGTRQNGPFAILTGIGNKQDLLYYIVARVRMPDIGNELQFLDSTLTYLRMADILLAHGLKSEDETRQKAIVALKCMLLIRSIAETSESVIVRNIRFFAHLRESCFIQSWVLG